MLSPERGTRMIAFRSSGTIPDVADYDVYFEERKTKVGQLDEGFVEELHTGDIFILGSSSWRVLGIEKNRVVVEDVYGQAPTIPFWLGERDSRTYDLGLLVGEFRRKMDPMLDTGKPGIENPASSIQEWLQKEYYVDENGAKSIYEYFREQRLVTGKLPSDRLIMIEHFRDELGQQQIVIHSSFGIRVNDPWAMALCQGIMETFSFMPQSATTDDGILITIPKDRKVDITAICELPLQLAKSQNLYDLLKRAILDSPVFSSRFRHNAVRSMMVLREYKGIKTPVWVQNMRASSLLDACRNDGDFPLMVETLRECMNEALDVPDLMKVMSSLVSGEIEVKTIETRIPSPFTHSLLLLGQYGDAGSIPTQERRSRLMHLHRELLRQILDEETLRNLLDEEAVRSVETRLQYKDPQRKARNANELARILLELGDLVDTPDDDISILDRVDSNAQQMLSELVLAHRVTPIHIPTVETNRERWISTENFPLYRAAFGMDIQIDDTDERIIQLLVENGPAPPEDLEKLPFDNIEKRIEKLISGYMVLGSSNLLVASKSWVPEHIIRQNMPRQEARLELMQRFMKTHGPITKYEIMERYGFSSYLVESMLENLNNEGRISSGEYVPTKSFPQWCYRSNLEEIHRLTLNKLRKEMEPATSEEYADFLIRWQHVHPDTQLSGLDGLREVIGYIQGQENFQGVIERDVLPGRIKDYEPFMLDRLCYSGGVIWRRFDYKTLKRGQIGFCFREDRDWIVADPSKVEMTLNKWDDDIPEVCDAVRNFLRKNGACFFGDIVKETKFDHRYVLRAIWHLVWTGEATNDSFESIRHASITSGLSGCYDLFKTPDRKGVTIEYIVKHMLEYRRLDPTLGRWAPTERLVPSQLESLQALEAPKDADKKLEKWAHLLLKRYGVLSRESLKLEASTPSWKDLRRALVRLELLGKVRKGFFVQSLSGEQYAYPEAVDALREAKLRHPDADGESTASEPMVLLNTCDPANLFTSFLTITSETGEEISFSRNPHSYMVIQNGQPILLYNGSVTLPVDLSKERAEKAIRTIMQIVDNPAKVKTYKEIHIASWNGHPIDVSPARHLLKKLGFVQSGSRWRGFVYDGYYKPQAFESPRMRGSEQGVGVIHELPYKASAPRDANTINQAEREIPELFECVGREKAPVKYDANWIISRSSAEIRSKVKELIELLERMLPGECEFVYSPREFRIRYRGVRCINIYIQQKKIWLQITHSGWTRGILVEPNTDANEPRFISEVIERFEETRRQIDSQLNSPRGIRDVHP